MEKMAVPTGDVVKDMDVDREEYLFFLLKNETSEFTIGLGDILECLKFAEEQGEVTHMKSMLIRPVITLYSLLDYIKD